MTVTTKNNLRTFFYPLIFTVSSTTAMAAGGLAILPDQIITESTLVPLGIFVVGVGVISTAAWKVATTVTRVVIRLEQIEKDRIVLMERMNRIEEKVNKLHS